MSDADKFFEDKTPLEQASRLFRVANRKAKSGNVDEAFRIGARGLIADPAASKADWLLLAENPKEFTARRDILRLMSMRLGALREKALSVRDSQQSDSGPYVFVYWGQGFAQAPPLVRKCLAQTKALVPESSLVLLDDSNLDRWVEIPSVIMDAREKSYAAFSDYVRFALLSEYGGIWMDATCYCMEDPSRRYEDLVSGGGFFAFGKRQEGVISSWFLASRRGSYISELNRLAQILYWSVFDEVTTYFFAHQIFRTLYRIDREFADIWNSRYCYRGNPRILHRSLKIDVSSEEFASRLSASFVHKLTYKVDSEVLGARTGYQRFMHV